ncbi:MAG: hypothetical protein EA398_16445, partial [Deltaproteobacteria bacterium]
LASSEAEGDGTFSAPLRLDGDRVGPTTLFATTTDPVGNTTRDERPITLLTPADPSDPSGTGGDDSSAPPTGSGPTAPTPGTDTPGTDTPGTGAPGTDGGDPTDASEPPASGDDAPTADDSGCGCAATPGKQAPSTLLLLLGLLALRRRGETQPHRR